MFQIKSTIQKKILRLKNVYRLFSHNTSKEIFLNIFPQFKYYERLKIIDSLDSKLRDKYDNYLILASLILDQTNNYEYFCHKYKMSNSIKNRFKNMSINIENLEKKNFFSEENVKNANLAVSYKRKTDPIILVYDKDLGPIKGKIIQIFIVVIQEL